MHTKMYALLFFIYQRNDPVIPLTEGYLKRRFWAIVYYCWRNFFFFWKSIKHHSAEKYWVFLSKFFFKNYQNFSGYAAGKL